LTLALVILYTEMVYFASEMNTR